MKRSGYSAESSNEVQAFVANTYHLLVGGIYTWKIAINSH